MMYFYYILLALALFIASCSSKPDVDENAGNQFTVVCRNEVQDCYTKAQELCPKGYIVINRVHGLKIDRETTEYRAIIRCKR